MEDKETEKLGKLIEMAKRGSDNEKEVAIKFIKNICRKHDLIFEEVMSKTELQEFEFNFKKVRFKGLINHIYARYGLFDVENFTLRYYVRGQRVSYRTTLSKHIEMINAFDILSKIFEKEQILIKESFELAFWNKHNLWYYTDKSDDEQKEPTKEEIKKAMMANSMQDNLQSAEIRKCLQ